jgi:hypothetical protein
VPEEGIDGTAAALAAVLGARTLSQERHFEAPLGFCT